MGIRYGMDIPEFWSGWNFLADPINSGTYLKFLLHLSLVLGKEDTTSTKKIPLLLAGEGHIHSK